jgi:hypothetical protein
MSRRAALRAVGDHEIFKTQTAGDQVLLAF